MNKVKDDPKLGAIDFSNAKPVSEVPALARLQAIRKSKKEPVLLQSEIFLIEPDVWQLIKAKANNKQLMADINGFLRVYLA